MQREQNSLTKVRHGILLGDEQNTSRWEVSKAKTDNEIFVNWKAGNCSSKKGFTRMTKSKKSDNVKQIMRIFVLTNVLAKKF